MPISWAPYPYVSPAFLEGQRQGGETLRAQMQRSAQQQMQDERLASEERRAAGVQTGATERQQAGQEFESQYKTPAETQARGLHGLLRGMPAQGEQLGSEHPEGQAVPGRSARTALEVYPTLTPEEQRGATGVVGEALKQSEIGARQTEVEIAKRDTRIQELEARLRGMAPYMPGGVGGAIPEGHVPTITATPQGPRVTWAPSAESKAAGATQGRLQAQEENLGAVEATARARGQGYGEGRWSSNEQALASGLVKAFGEQMGFGRTIGSREGALQGPASHKELTSLWLPQYGDFAANVPAIRGLSTTELVRDHGAVDANTRGGVSQIVKTEEGAAAAHAHINAIRNGVLKAAQANLMPTEKQGLASSYIEAWKRSIRDKSNPILAELTALNKGDLQILAGFAPPTGNRFGFQILKYINSGNPAEISENFTVEGALAALKAWDRIVDVKQQSQGIGALGRKPGESLPMEPPPSAAPTSGPKVRVFDPRKGDFAK